jgi:Arc/MetJ family transcription regulator
MSRPDGMLRLSERRHIMARVKRTSLNLDFELVEKARAELGTNGTTDTVHRALDEVVRQAAIGRLLEIRFDEDDIDNDEIERLWDPWEHER